MKPSPPGLIFTIEVDGKPTVSFEARQLREASELRTAEWLRADLTTLNSNGVPLCGIGSKPRARIANEAEGEIYRQAAIGAEASDDILFAPKMPPPVDPGVGTQVGQEPIEADRRSFSMRILASLAVAAVILFFLDQAFNYGHYSDALLRLLREIGRSFGIS